MTETRIIRFPVKIHIPAEELYAILTAYQGEMERIRREIVRIFDIPPQLLGLTPDQYGS